MVVNLGKGLSFFGKAYRYAKHVKGNVAERIGDKIFSKTGIMTHKTQVRYAQNVGQDIVESQVKKGNISIDDVIAIVKKRLGKKHSSKFEIIRSEEEFIDVFSRVLNVPRSFAKDYYHTSLSAVVPRGNGDKAFLNLRLSCLSPKQIGNVSAHELEHLFYRTFSKESKWANFYYYKTKLGRFKFNYLKLPKAQLYNAKLSQIENELLGKWFGSNACDGFVNNPKTIKGLLSHCGCKNIEELHAKIRGLLFDKNILELKKDGQNVEVSKFIAATLEDESRAYNAGGAIERVYDRLTQVIPNPNATKSEMYSMLYDEVVKVLKQEKKYNVRHCWAKLFGYKPQYTRERKAIEQAHKLEKQSKNLAQKTIELPKPTAQN